MGESKTRKIAPRNKVEVLRFDNYNVLDILGILSMEPTYYKKYYSQTHLLRDYFRSQLKYGSIVVHNPENKDAPTIYVNKNYLDQTLAYIVHDVAAWVEHIDIMLRNMKKLDEVDITKEKNYAITLYDEHMDVRISGSEKFLVGFIGKDMLDSMIADFNRYERTIGKRT